MLAESPELEIIPSNIENVGSGSITGYENGKFIAKGAKSIRLFDVNGKRLTEVDGESMNMNDLPDAMYLIQYTDETGTIHTVKVVK